MSTMRISEVALRFKSPLSPTLPEEAVCLISESIGFPWKKMTNDGMGLDRDISAEELR